MGLNKRLETQPKFVVIGLGILLVAAISRLSFLVNQNINFCLFYLIPILFVTRFAGKESGFLVSIISAAAGAALNFLHGSKELNLAIYLNAALNLTLFILATHLFSELQQAIHREKTLARIDYLTGLANRALFFELAQLEIKRAYRYRHPITIAYIDIDDFKLVNDKLGYRVGDLVLQEVATALKNNLRQTDIIARLGGDEFAIFLPGSGFEPAKIVLQRVQEQLVAAMQKQGWPLTFSIGAVTLVNPPDSVNEMLEKADCLMYFVKNNGKDGLEHRTGI